MRLNLVVELPICIVLLFLVGCATRVTDVGDVNVTAVDNQYWDELAFLKRQADQFNEKLKRDGLIYRNSEVSRVVERIGREVIPQAGGDVQFRFFVIKHPAVNAFALPDGSIYVHTGLLAMLENEAQLATVLGHEVAHVIHRHSLEQVLTTRKTLIGTHITDILLTGVGLSGFAYLGAAAGLASYNRDQEREADISGLSYMADVGYSIAEAPKIWALMQKQPGVAAIKSSIYSSHPDNAKRAEYLHRLIAENLTSSLHKGRVNAEQYQHVKAILVELNIKLWLRYQQYEHADMLVETAEKYSGKTALLKYYRGEIQRGIASFPEAAAREKQAIAGSGKVADFERAIEGQQKQIVGMARQHYLDAIGLDANYAPSYRGLGLLEGSFGNKPTAVTYLKKYLELAGTPKDKRFINNMIEEFQR